MQLYSPVTKARESSAGNAQTLLKLFAAYIVVGGMPDVVQTYVNTHDIGKVIQVQRNILELYRQDIAKYAEVRIR